MNYTSSTNANFGFNYPNGTAEPYAPCYFRKDFSYIPRKVLFRLNMPLLFEPNAETGQISVKEDAFSFFIADAVKRYKEMNNGASFDLTKADDFLAELKRISGAMKLEPYIILNKFALKVQFSFNNKDFVLDHDFEDIDSIFVLSSIDGTVVVKESALDKLEETLRSF